MKRTTALFTCLILIIALFTATTSAVASATSADLSICPATSKELETAVTSAFKQAIKNRKNENTSGEWPQTSFTVAIDFSSYADAPVTINTDNNALNTDISVLGLEFFDILSDDPDLDYEFLVLKGGESQDDPSTFGISFIISYDFDCKVTALTVTYTLTWGESKAETASVSSWCQNVVAETLTSGMTDYEKFKALHDYVALNFAYATDELAAGNQNIYYPRYMLANGRGVCQAYTALYLKLCQTAGLTVRAVRHETEAKTKGKWEKHAWNLVKLDGKWYHVDVTWDDTASTNNYFLKSDSSIGSNHRWRSDFYPAAKTNYTPSAETSSVASSNPTSSTTSSNPASSTTSSNPASSTPSSNPTSSAASSNPTSSTTSSNPTSSTTSSNPTSSTTSSEPTSSVTSSEPTSSATSSEPSSLPESSDVSNPADSSEPAPINSDESSGPASEDSSEASETSSDVTTTDVTPSQSSDPVNSSPEPEKSIFTLSPLIIAAVVALTALVVISVAVIIISKKKK